MQPSNVKNTSRQWLITLMVCSVGLLLLIAWQSWQTQQQYRNSIQNVLQDYAHLAADEYARQIQSKVGFWIAHRAGQNIVNASRQTSPTLEAILNRTTIENTTRENAQLARALASVNAVYHWSPEKKNTPLLALYQSQPLTADYLSIWANALAVESLASNGSAPFRTMHWTWKHQSQTAIAYLVESVSEPNFDRQEGRQWILIQLDPAALSEWYQEIFSRQTLLPDSLTSKLSSTQQHNELNTGIHLELLDLANRSVFSSSALSTEAQRHSSITTTIGDDYGGLFSNFQLTVSIDESLANGLVIGGLPSNQWPLVLLMVLFSSALLSASLWLMIKEQKLALLREQFVAEVSHELRTPLTQIRMFSETLLLGRAKDASLQERYLKLINHESQRLSHLVDRVLHFSKARRDTALILEPVAVNQLIRSVLENYQTLAEDCQFQLELSTDEETTVHANSEALRQVLLNLMDNAVKYGPKTQCVQVQTSLVGQQVKIRIIDQGSGIPVSELKKIWLPFHRSRSESYSSVAGAGIGLTIVKQLCEQMRAECALERQSSAASGACFVVTLSITPIANEIQSESSIQGEHGLGSTEVKR